MKAVFLTKGQVEAYQAAKKFFERNDALPSHRTLGNLINRSHFTMAYTYKNLIAAGLVEINDQGGYRFTRDKFEIVECTRPTSTRKRLAR